MATVKGQVTLRGRFRAGSVVKLVKVADERVLRAEGGTVAVAEATVDEDGLVRFTEGVEVGARYLIVGQVDGEPVQVRARGNAVGDDNSVLAQAPIQPDRQKLSGGQFADEVVPFGAPRQADVVAPVEAAEPAPPAAPKPVRRAAVKRAVSRKRAAAKQPAAKSTTAKPASRSARKER